MEEKYKNKYVYVPSISAYNAFNVLNIPYKKDFALDCLESRITYSELTKMVVDISKSFKELGVKKGDIITVNMPNYIQGVAVFLAANRIGAAVSFLNANSSMTEIVHYLNEFGSKLFVNYNKTQEENKYIKDNTSVEQIITLYNKDLNNMNFSYEKENLGYSNYLSYQDLGALSKYQKGLINPYLYGGNCDALLSFTSGSSGSPKVVVLTNRNIIASGKYCQATTGVKSGGQEKALDLVSYDVPYGFVCSVLMPLLCGKEVVLTPDLCKDNISYYMEKGIDLLYGTPLFFELLMKNAKEDLKIKDGVIAFSGGDVLSISDFQNIKEFFVSHGCPNVHIANGSGNAETTATSTSAAGRTIKPETVGVPLVGSEVKIVDKDTLEEKPRGEAGIFCVSGKHVFDRYYNNPEATKKAKIMIDGKEYFKSDTYYIHRDDDYMEIVGREGRFFITLAEGNGVSFYKVYCNRIQNYIQAIDIIDSCAIVKSYDEKALSSPRAYIVLKDGVSKTKEVEDYLFNCFNNPIKNPLNDEYFQLKSYEIPTSIEFVDELPTTRAGKIDYKKLEEDSMSKTTPHNEMTRVKK